MEHGLLVPRHDHILGRQHHPGKALILGEGHRHMNRQSEQAPLSPPYTFSIPTPGSPAMLKVKFWLLQVWPKALWAQQE